MESVNTAAGTVEFGPGVARGLPTHMGMKKLADLSTGAAGPAAVQWRDTATVCVLGQLAVSNLQSRAKIIRSVCAVAKDRHSLSGLESIFLSAVASAAQDPEALDTADSVWAALDDPAGTGGLVPVLNPDSSELYFLSRDDIRSLQGSMLRAQLLQLCKTHAVAPASDHDMIVFGTHLLVAASAIASSQIVSGYPDDSSYTADAVKTIPAAQRQRSMGLPHALLAGTAVLVETLLLQGTAPTQQTGLWRSVWPTTALAAPSEGTVQALSHPYWTAAQLCPAWPASGGGLAGLLAIRGGLLILPQMPRFDPSDAIVQHGFYPPLTQDGPGENKLTWRGQRPLGRVQGPSTTGIDTRIPIIIGGNDLDLLTGGDPVAHWDHLITGRNGLGYGQVASLQERLAATCRSSELPATATLEQAVTQLIEIDYGLRLAGPDRRV